MELMEFAVRLTGVMARCRISRISLGQPLRAASLMSLLALGGCAFISGSPSSSAASCLTSTVSVELVSFQVSGGFAGVDDRLTIDRQGVVLLTHRAGKQSRANLSQQELNQLKETLANAEFQSLKPKYVNANAYDAFSYTVRYSAES